MNQEIYSEQSELFLDKCAHEIIEISQIEQFLDAGVDINYQSTKDGYTALMLAVDNDDQIAVTFLLDNRANPFIKNYYGETAGDIALRYSPIYLLIKNYELLTASFLNDLDAVKLAIACGADIHFEGVHGNTAIIIANEQKHQGLVNYLEQLNSSL